MEIRKNKLIIYDLFYFLSFPILYLIFVLCAKVDFIPIFNNILLGISVLLFFAYQIFFINRFTKIRANFYLKLVMTLILIGIGFFAGYIILIVSVFSVKDGESFSYGGEDYYILNEGWLDDNFVIYKKDFITMDKMDFEESEKAFKDLDKIANKDAKARLRSYLFRDQEMKPSQSSNESNLENKDPNEQEILNEFSFEDVKKLRN